MIQGFPNLFTECNQQFNFSVDPMAETDIFTDGLWHGVQVDIESGGETRIGRINITVDGRTDLSNRQLSFSTEREYLIGGNLKG